MIWHLLALCRMENCEPNKNGLFHAQVIWLKRSGNCSKVKVRILSQIVLLASHQLRKLVAFETHLRFLQFKKENCRSLTTQLVLQASYNSISGVHSGWVKKSNSNPQWPFSKQIFSKLTFKVKETSWSVCFLFLHKILLRLCFFFWFTLPLMANYQLQNHLYWK